MVVEEIWVNIDGTRHEISNYGRVRMWSASRGVFVYRRFGSDRYLKFTLRLNGLLKHFRVHRLVGLYFVPNPENKPCINHKDGNKWNNYFENLEWVTVAENNAHAMDIGLARRSKPFVKKLRHEKNIPKRPVSRQSTGELFASINDAARLIGLKSPGNIGLKIRGEHGHKNKDGWRYLTPEEIVKYKNELKFAV